MVARDAGCRPIAEQLKQDLHHARALIGEARAKDGAAAVCELKQWQFTRLLTSEDLSTSAGSGAG